MSFFADNTERRWRVGIVYETVCLVREDVGVDLLSPNTGDPPPWLQLQYDDATFCNVLYVVCEEQVKAAGLSERKFGKRMKGVIDEARAAFFESWFAFFPVPDGSEEEPGNGKVIDLDKFVWQFAGELGVHPGPFTLRQLATMFEGACRQQWRHTSSIMALLAEINRDRRRRSQSFTPADFDPYRPKSNPPKVSMRFLFETLKQRNEG